MKPVISYERDSLLSDQAMKLLRNHYMKKYEKSPQEAYARAAYAFCGGDYELAQRIYDYASKQWFMFSSPILSNAPGEEGPTRGLPISCFLSYVPDTVDGLVEHEAETKYLSIEGGGVGGHWSSVRATDKKSPGPIPFIHSVDAAMTAYKQGVTRKGAYASYIDVSHPSIQEFLSIRVPTGGDVNRKCFNIHNAVNLTDEFMEAVDKGDSFNLVCPKTQEVKDTVDARQLFQHILTTRFRTGEPYLNFIDTANAGLNECQRDKGLSIKGSNLCNEIHLVTDEERTAVCCLSSVNIEKWDEWKDTQMIEDLVRLLDNVLTYFIDNAPESLSKAVYSASKERSIGLGAMGWHGFLQSKSVPFESIIALAYTNNIFGKIREKAEQETARLAKERGTPDDLSGSGRRNAHLLAIAPNANSSIICGCSPSIEPIRNNAYTHRTRVGTHLVTNPHLEALLEKKGYNTEEVWSSIINNNGSVQHLAFLSDQEKEVFKTFEELDMHWVIEQASARQQHLDQGQSVNLYFPAGADKAYVKDVHMAAWSKGLKGLYYLRTSSGASADKVGQKIERKSLSSSVASADECLACHA